MNTNPNALAKCLAVPNFVFHGHDFNLFATRKFLILSS